MAKKQPDAADHLDDVAKGATSKDAARLARAFAHLDIHDETRADLIALVACLAYCEPRERDGMLYEVINVLLPDFSEPRRVVERLAAERIRAQEGGTE